MDDFQAPEKNCRKGQKIQSTVCISACQYVRIYAEAFNKDAAQRHQKQVKERQCCPEAEKLFFCSVGAGRPPESWL